MTDTNTDTVEIGSVPDFWEQVQRAEHLFLGLDYDGTLAPFEVDPMQARPLPGAADLIRDLAANERTQVAIISGRPVAEVRALLNNPPVTIIGSHGFEFCSAGGECVARQPTAPQARGLLEVRTSLEARDYAHKVEIKVASVALHTRGMDPAAAVALEEELSGEWAVRAPEFGLECRRFNGGVEIRCTGRDKGTALLELLGLQPENVLPVYVGDDDTDEDAFNVLLGSGIGIKVGDDRWPTAARGFLPDCLAVVDFLRAWVAHTKTPSTPKR
ncbi:MAG: trehalose-phosphatase [Desulfobulbus sp.]|jgi:trehalose-phosphatase|nr:trehalose-phosphatase [Desulfobulbus sp.]